MTLDDRGGHHPLDEGVAHIGQGGVAVQPGFGFHLHDAVLQKLLFVFVQLQVLLQRVAPLNELGSAEPGGDAQSLGVVGDEVDNGVQAAVDGGVVGAEIGDLRQDAAPCHRDGPVDQLRNTFALGGGNGHHRDAEGGAQFLHIDRTAVGPHLIHHVEGKHHRHPQLQKLEGEVEVAFDVGGVHDIDDAVRLLIEDKIPGDDLLLRIGPQRIDARQIDDGTVFSPRISPIF